MLILFPEALVNLSNKNKQRTPTPNMKCHQTEQSTRDALRRDIHIPKGVYCLLVLDRLKFTRFLSAKTSANKRFYTMSAKPIARIGDCNGSEIFLIKQIFDKKTERFVQPPR